MYHVLRPRARRVGVQVLYFLKVRRRAIPLLTTNRLLGPQPLMRQRSPDCLLKVFTYGSAAAAAAGSARVVHRYYIHNHN